MSPLTFDEALARASGKRHLLLGNGFSRAIRKDIFAYAALFERANFEPLSPSARKAFDALGTTDFESVLRALKVSSKLVPLYAPEAPSAAQRLSADSDALRNLLAETIAKNHPERPHEISTDAYRACRAFLRHFVGSLYTLNYDLLLYWSLMQSELLPSIDSDDGFRQPDDGPTDYVTWDPSESHSQRVFYLHGALHLFDAGSSLTKMTWVNTGLPLVDQIRSALGDGLFPVVVTEGTSEEKKEKIMHSGYLSRGYRSFAQITGSLFTFGFAMSSQDEHWLRLIERGRTSVLAVGMYGDPTSPGNKVIIARAEALRAARSTRKPLELLFYDAASAGVWGGTEE